MKTSNYLKVSLGFLVTANIILAIAEAISKKKLKNCESRQSFRCPRFTCPEKSDQCGVRPWICLPNEKICSNTCVGNCSKGDNNCFD